MRGWGWCVGGGGVERSGGDTTRDYRAREKQIGSDQISSKHHKDTVARSTDAIVLAQIRLIECLTPLQSSLIHFLCSTIMLDSIFSTNVNPTWSFDFYSS